MNFAQKSRNLKASWRQKRMLVSVRKLLRMRTGPSWAIFLVALFLLLLSGCASAPCPPLSQPPQVLMVPPPAPGAMTDRLEAILKQGQTSAPNSTASPKPVTPK